MLKNISVIFLVIMLGGCVSQPSEKGFKGPDDFDKVEAAQTRVSLGLTYLKNGSFSQAKFNLDKALEFDPRSGQANYAMAFYYQQVDEISRAHEYYKQAIELSSDDPDILNSYGAFLCRQGDYKQAKRYFLQAVDDKRYVSTAQTYENLALCAQNQNLIAEAIGYFNSAINHQPTRASSLMSLAQLYVQTTQWDDAKKALWKYERSASVTEESLWLSFQIAQGQRDMRGALEYAQQLKRLYPASPKTEKALLALGKFQPNMAITQKTATAPVESSSMTSVITMDDVAASNAQTAAQMQQKAAQPIVNTLVTNNSVPNVKARVDESLTLNSDDVTSKAQNSRETEFHIVLPKENLYRISLKYNVKIKKLLEWNNLQDSSSIPIGTKLWLRDPN